MLVQIQCDGPKPFTAGIILTNDIRTLAAPILRRSCFGKDRDTLRAMFAAPFVVAEVAPSR